MNIRVLDLRAFATVRVRWKHIVNPLAFIGFHRNYTRQRVKTVTPDMDGGTTGENSASGESGGDGGGGGEGGGDEGGGDGDDDSDSARSPRRSTQGGGRSDIPPISHTIFLAVISLVLLLLLVFLLATPNRSPSAVDVSRALAEARRSIAETDEHIRQQQILVERLTKQIETLEQEKREIEDALNVKRPQLRAVWDLQQKNSWGRLALAFILGLLCQFIPGLLCEFIGIVAEPAVSAKWKRLRQRLHARRAGVPPGPARA